MSRVAIVKYVCLLLNEQFARSVTQIRDRAGAIA